MPKEPAPKTPLNQIGGAILKLPKWAKSEAYLAYVRISLARQMPKEPAYLV